MYAGILLLELSREGVELRLGTRDEDDVEALGGELGSEFLAEAIRCAGDDGPGALLAILAELVNKTS